MSNATAINKLAQERLKSLGFDPGDLDGVIGPETEDALTSYLISRQKPSNFAEILVELAKYEVSKSIRETSKNQGEGIEKYWQATSYPNGYANREPYCAAFVCYVVNRALNGLATKLKAPSSPVAYDLEKWATANKQKGVSVFAEPKRGDLFTLATASHCGIVQSVHRDLVLTIEANTNAAGSREGDGVYYKSRKISDVRQFIRIAI